MKTTYIALGSNLEIPVQQIEEAIEALRLLPSSELVTVSSFYQSQPLGPQDQPDYVNAVACLRTTLSPLLLLDELQRIENEQGRVRVRRWGERTLDLDILLYEDFIIQDVRLTIPHYDMKNREFVIVPLYEIAPLIVFPDGLRLTELIGKFTNHQMKIIKKAPHFKL